MQHPNANTNLPLVTFLSPCYNHEKYVIQSLETVKNQTYSNVHHIIIDDASTDNSVFLIENWIKENNYQCTFIKHLHNKGISSALNESINLATGTYWTCVATDDYLHPERTEKFVAYLTENPDMGMVASDMQIVNDSGKEILINNTSGFLQNRTSYHPNFTSQQFGSYDSLLFDNYMPGSIMVKTSVFKNIGLYNENLQMEDWDMWLRISAKYKIGFINEPLAYYRKHTHNSINFYPQKMRRSMFETFLNQKQFCYSNNKKEIFERAYIHHFCNYYDPVRHFSTSIIFHRIHFFIYIKAVINKIKRMSKKIFSKKKP